MVFDVEQARRDTPGVAHVAHFNNAGAALAPRPVLDAVVAHLEREATIGGYEAAAEAKDRIDAVYSSLAALIGATTGEIAVVENATRAWDMAVYGYPFARHDRVLTGRAEYASNVIGLLQLQRRVGFEIVLVDDDAHGQISLDHLERELARGATLVALTHVPTSGGLVNPAAEVGRLCRANGTFYVLDACQAVGQLPIDVDEIGCDVLSATGRKYLRAPRGTGFLYVRAGAGDVLDPPLLDLHAAVWTSESTYEVRRDARRFENWETNYAAKLGLGAAAAYALELDVATTWPVVRRLGAELRRRLRELAGVTVHDQGEVQGGIVTFSVSGMTAPSVQQLLARAGINTSVSLPEYARYDLPARGLPAVVRASVHYYNTADEIDRLLDELRRAQPVRSS